jgi:hypothetical protein
MQKTIKPISIWTNGTSQNANVFNMISISDNLLDVASFYYQLLDVSTIEDEVNSIILVEGNITLNSDEYPLWDGTNEWIINWAAEKLNLEII